jgi:hypothetical protein
MMRLLFIASTTIQKIKTGGKVRKITNNLKLIDSKKIYWNELKNAVVQTTKITPNFATLFGIKCTVTNGIIAQHSRK